MIPVPLDADRLIGSRYILESLIGQGGMGEVWRARHTALKSLVAIKFLHRASAFSQSMRKRFLTEAQVTANLKTRHAVQVFDFGVTDDGLPYLVMEYLEGETLQKRIVREGRLSAETTFTLLRQAARALDRAHALGIVHRDFKPENLIIVADEDGGEQAKVVDFGIAKILGDLELYGIAPPSSHATRLDAGTSGSNSAVGTPYYMAPEQVQDASKLGPAADIWAFGIVAYECLTGRRPFDDDNIVKLLRRIVEGTPPVPASAHAPLPLMFDEWFQIACARNPDDRFQDAFTAVSALAVALDLPPMPATASRTSAPGPPPAPKRVVSPMAETLDARKSTRPSRPSDSQVVVLSPSQATPVPEPAREATLPPPLPSAFEPSPAVRQRRAPSEPAPRALKTAESAPRAPALWRPRRVVLVGVCAVAVITITLTVTRRAHPSFRANGANGLSHSPNDQKGDGERKHFW